MLRIITLLFIIMAASSQASPLAEFKKVGAAKLEVLFWDIYISELYSPDGRFVPENYPIALKIRYLRDIKARSLVERTAEEWSKLGYSEQQINAWLANIQDLWPDIRKGDELLLVIDQQGQSQFYYNDTALGLVPDPTFGAGFAAIWLDEKSSYPDLRAQLIGKDS